MNLHRLTKATAMPARPLMPLALAALSACLAGCAGTTTPSYDMRFGDAMRQSQQAMRVNATPPAPAQGIEPTDGKAVREAGERYHDSFRKPPAPVNVINIGSGGAR